MTPIQLPKLEPSVMFKPISYWGQGLQVSGVIDV